MTVHSSTQNPSEIQAVVAHCLGLRQNKVVCTCTRMGGGFGGKESQAAHPALLAALVAHKTGRPARIVYSRDLDMRVTGKRHPYLSRYRPAFDPTGGSRPSSSTSTPTAAARPTSRWRSWSGRCSTPTMPTSFPISPSQARSAGPICRSNTAMRGFGGPQGIAAIENVIEEIAAYLGHRCARRAPAQLSTADRRATSRPMARWSRTTRCPIVLDRLAETSDYVAVASEIARFNATSRTHLRGIALTPVKFGISFTRRTLNQANALVNIYLDGTIQVSTGGTEMGQGLNTKIRQLVADEFALPLESVRVMPTSTEKNNNTSPTAASASTDLNGTAALRAATILKARLAEAAARHFASAADGIEPSPGAHRAFERAGVHDIRRPGRRLAFRELVKLAYEDRVDLGARGFYATPGVDFNRETGRGNPFLYFTNGAAVSEVVIDRLTGELAVDARRHPDGPRPIAQPGDRPRPGDRRVRPGHGLGDDRGAAATPRLGELLSHSPNNYKIPERRVHAARLAGRFPREFRQPDQPAGQQGRGRAAVRARDQRGGGRQVGPFESLAGPLAGPFVSGDERRDPEASAGASSPRSRSSPDSPSVRRRIPCRNSKV